MPTSLRGAFGSINPLDAAAPAETAPPGPGRLKQLDGLRGIASLVVLLSHVLLVVPAIAEPYFEFSVGEIGSFEWWINHTPLKLLSAGTEAVYVFFILSGFVVALPALHRSAWSWASYYPQRIVRLYVPTIAALAFAYVLALIYRDASLVGSPWLQQQAGAAGTKEMILDATLQSQFRLNNPLWSIEWEIVFSLTLPLYLAIARLLRRPWIPVLVGLLVVIVGLITAGIYEVSYVLMFAIGVVIASQFEKFTAIAARIESTQRSNLVWAVLLGISLVSLIAYWVFWPDQGAGGNGHRLLRGLAVLGATLLVLVACFWKAFFPFFGCRPVQWLGRVSFSLYLVHVPILATLVFALASAPLWVVLPLAVLICLLASQLFHWVIERPSHQLSRRIGRRASKLSSPRGQESSRT